MSLEEYLHTSFENPHPEYWDGEIVERSNPTSLHGETAVAAGVFLAPFDRIHNLVTAMSVTHVITPQLALIPDICVHRGRPADPYPIKPPLAIVEVLSPNDSLLLLTRKFRHFLSYGVEHMWAIDPESRAFYLYNSDGLRQVRQLEIPEFGIVVSPSDIFRF